MFIAYDATQMGTQTAAALLGDMPTAKLVNMVEAPKKADVYSTIAKVVEASVKAMPKSESPELKEFYYANKAVMFDRNVFKKPTMTVLYGAGVKTFEGQLIADLKEVTGDKLSPKAAIMLAKLTMEALKEVIPAPIELMKSLTGIVKQVIKVTGQPFVFTTAMGTKFKAGKYKEMKFDRLGSVFGYEMQIEYKTDVLDPNSSAKSAAAQFIQSFDAAIAGEIQQGMSEAGVPCLSVFDSWSVPADQSKLLLKVAKQAYVKHLSGNPLQAFYDEALENYPFLADKPELFLAVGDYDVAKELKKAKLFIGL